MILLLSAALFASIVTSTSVASPKKPSPDSVIQAARRTAQALALGAPDYIVKRRIYRYRGVRPSWTITAESIHFWELLNTTSVSLTIDHGRETYSNLTVNGFPSDWMPAGISTSGELFAEPLIVLSSDSAAVLSHPQSQTLRKHRTYRYDFAVDQSHSTWRVNAAALPGAVSTASCNPAFSGRIWIDITTHQTLRIEASSSALPKDFPLEWVDLKTDYDLVTIAGKSYPLPIHAKAYACKSETEKQHDLACYWNDSLFTGYGRLTSGGKLHVNPAGQ